jgi:predicted transcriptional regulator
MKDTTIRIDRDTLNIATKLAERYGITQKAVLEQAVSDFYERYKKAAQMPMIAREVRSKYVAGDEEKKAS